MNFVVDIDDTLLKTPSKVCGKCGRKIYDVENVRINEKEIVLMNELYEQGNVIILHTGRNWDCYDVTIKQLKKYGIKYNQLVMGKPQGVYIDRDSYKSITEFLSETQKAEEKIDV
jgi:hypothetical protein